MAEGSYKLTDRRPIAARQRPWARHLAGMLARRGVSANGISLAGMVAGGLAGAALAVTAHVAPPWHRAGFVAAAVLMQLRLLANLLDGMVAVEAHTASAVGELYNEVPDRVSDTAILVGAGFGAGGTPMLGVFAALVAMLTAYVRVMGKSAGAPHDFSGPMAKPHRMALLTGVALLLACAPATWTGAVLGGVSWMDAALWIIIVGGLWTALRRLRHIARQLRG